MQDPGELVIQDSVLLTPENPWPGLVSFSEANQAFFFGRDREIADLAHRVKQETLTVLFGKSGLGKSSILRAGLGPVLRKSEFVPIYIRLDHSEEAAPLSEQIKTQMIETLDSEKIDAPRPTGTESLWEYFHTNGCDWWDHDNRLVKPVLICDQFEELLTIGQDTPARVGRTRAFLAELGDLIDNRVPAALQKRLEAERGLGKNYDFDRVAYQVILALREDFLADLESLHERLRPIMRNRFRLLPMTGEQALDVILKPGGRLVDEDVAVRIVNFVSSSERSRSRGSLVREEISGRQVKPALLSVVLQELNNRRLHSGASSITADLVGDGQAAEILQDFYERSLLDMDKRVRDFIVDCLLTASGARNRIAEEDALAKPAITTQVIAALIDRRIIQRHSSGNVKWLELSHDTLADVVRADRTEYEQRRAVAAAAARATEAHRNLVRSRRLVAIFASLLVVAGAGLIFAFIEGRGLRKSTADLKASNKLLEQQRQTLDDKNKKLLQGAQEQADKILESLRQELADQKPGAGSRTLAELNQLAVSATQFPLDIQQTLGNALGAQILYSYGYVKEGFAAAQKATQLVGKLSASVPASDELRLIRAATNYALGKGEMEEGHLDEAEKHLRSAVGLVESIPPTFSQANRRDAQQTWALAQMAVGDVQLNRYDVDEAKKEYQRLLARLSGNSAHSDELLVYCKARVYQQLALSEEQYEQAAVNFDKAQLVVRKMMNGHLDNLWWRTLFAELAYRQASAMMNFGRFSDGFRLLREAKPIAENVYNMDNDNLHGVYVLALANRGLGTFYWASGAQDNAQASFQPTIQFAKTLNTQQPSWVVGRNLYGAVRLDEANATDAAKKYDQKRRRTPSAAVSSKIWPPMLRLTQRICATPSWLPYKAARFKVRTESNSKRF
ncbi:MAG: hypothetical protein ACR2NN_15195 [Bryobacteraceae bacterium]